MALINNLAEVAANQVLAATSMNKLALQISQANPVSGVSPSNSKTEKHWSGSGDSVKPDWVQKAEQKQKSFQDKADRLLKRGPYAQKSSDPAKQIANQSQTSPAAADYVEPKPTQPTTTPTAPASAPPVAAQQPAAQPQPAPQPTPSQPASTLAGMPMSQAMVPLSAAALGALAGNLYYGSSDEDEDEENSSGLGRGLYTLGGAGLGGALGYFGGTEQGRQTMSNAANRLAGLFNKTSSVSKQARNIGLSSVKDITEGGRGPMMEHALNLLMQARAMARPTDEDLKGYGTKRPEFEEALKRIVNANKGAGPEDKLDVTSVKASPKARAIGYGLAAGIPSALLGYKTNGIGGALAAGLIGGGGAGLYGASSAGSENKHNLAAAKALRDYGILTPGSLSKVIPLLSDKTAAEKCECCGKAPCQCPPNCSCGCKSKSAAAKPGLWANIHAKKERGEAPAKPGDKDYPTAKNWKKVTQESEKKAGLFYKNLAAPTYIGTEDDAGSIGLAAMNTQEPRLLTRLFSNQTSDLKKAIKHIHDSGMNTKNMHPTDMLNAALIEKFPSRYRNPKLDELTAFMVKDLSDYPEPKSKNEFDNLIKKQYSHLLSAPYLSSEDALNLKNFVGALGSTFPEKKNKTVKKAWEVGDETGNYSNHPLMYASYLTPPPKISTKHPDYDKEFVSRTLRQAVKKLKDNEQLHWIDPDADLGPRAWYNPMRYLDGKNAIGEKRYTLGSNSDEAAHNEILKKILENYDGGNMMVAFNPANKEAASVKKASPAWQTSEGKSESGGLNDKGRASLKAQGHDIKRPQPEGGPRKDSFCARMKGMKSKLTSEETARDPDSRINKALRKWKCGSAAEKLAFLSNVAANTLGRAIEGPKKEKGLGVKIQFGSSNNSFGG